MYAIAIAQILILLIDCNAIALIASNERELASTCIQIEHFIHRWCPFSMRERFKQRHANVLVSIRFKKLSVQRCHAQSSFLKWFEFEFNTNWFFMAAAVVWNCRSNHDQASNIWSDWLGQRRNWMKAIDPWWPSHYWQQRLLIVPKCRCKFK